MFSIFPRYSPYYEIKKDFKEISVPLANQKGDWPPYDSTTTISLYVCTNGHQRTVKPFRCFWCMAPKILEMVPLAGGPFCLALKWIEMDWKIPWPSLKKCIDLNDPLLMTRQGAFPVHRIRLQFGAVQDQMSVTCQKGLPHFVPRLAFQSRCEGQVVWPLNRYPGGRQWPEVKHLMGKDMGEMMSGAFAAFVILQGCEK